jgi:hypothetical protein
MTAGSITLNPAQDAADPVLAFPAARGLAAMAVTVRLDAASPLVEGTYPQGRVRGFRLAHGAELPTAKHRFTLVIDQGERDGFTVPAGLGWATGTLSTSGAISLTGQLGDARSFTAAPFLSATGQAILWVKPYHNPNSWLGGIVSFRESGLAAAGATAAQEPGLRWNRAPDAAELSYPDGFGPLQAQPGVAPYDPPASAGALAAALGLTQQTFADIMIEGGGLPDVDAAAALPQALTLDDRFELRAVPEPGILLAPWSGSVRRKDGTISGILRLSASGLGIVDGSAPVKGVLLPGGGFEAVVAAGWVKIPVSDRKGAFRTAALVISK